MKFFKKIILFTLIFCICSFLLSCNDATLSKLSNTNKNLLPTYVKKIAIMKFQDNFKKSLFQDKLYFSIKDKFTTDRRVEVVDIENADSEADAVLIGTISRYVLQPLEYDSNKSVTKYSLWIWVDISLYDAYTKRILWTENHLETKVEYNTSSKSNSFFNPTTESEAQDSAIENLADIIVKRTLDGWFTASGATERIYS
jgi:hypothetical protein